jgi:DNA-binding response OmpR family regulator
MANVLIIEDSQPTANAQAYRLWESGHTVAFAHTGKEALACFGANRYDVVLLDYDLPDTTGLELYRALQKIDPRTAVVMVTGRGDERLAAQILKEGAKDYLTKSGSLLEILPGVVDRVLKEQDVQRELAARERDLQWAHDQLEITVARRTKELQTINRRLEQEIDYRRRIELALLETNQDMLAILDSVSDGFVSIAGDFSISYLNRAARQWLAPDLQNGLDTDFFEAFPWATALGLKTKLAGVLKTGRQIVFEAEVNAGPLHGWLELRLYPRPEGVAIQFQVTTQRKIREIQSEKQRQLLSCKLGERTARISGVNRPLQSEIDDRQHAEKHSHSTG